VATWDDVRAVAADLPGAVASTAYGQPAWKVRDRLFAWQRPLRRAELDELGDRAPAGLVVGFRVADEGVKQALVAEVPAAFTTAHFDGYPAVLVALDDVGPDELRELVVEAWADRAPAAAVREHLGDGR
jgi:hypothetical protein